MHWLYRVLITHTVWLYGEPNDPSLRTPSIKNGCFCIYMIVLYWPFFRPLMFLADLFDRYTTKRCIAKCFRMAEDPRTTREDFLKFLGGYYEDEGAASLADYFMEKKKP